MFNSTRVLLLVFVFCVLTGCATSDDSAVSRQPKTPLEECLSEAASDNLVTFLRCQSMARFGQMTREKQQCLNDYDQIKMQREDRCYARFRR